MQQANKNRNIYTRRVSKTEKSGLGFPVARIKSMLRVHNYGRRISDTGAVFMAAILEYITAEILELSLNAARSNGSSRINPKQVNLVLKTDEDLSRNFMSSTIPRAGHVTREDILKYRPHINNQMPSANVKQKKERKRRSKSKSKTLN